MQTFLRSTFGPVGRDLAARAQAVADDAAENATNNIIDIRTGDLIRGIRAQITQDADGLVALVGSDAIHRDFAYPGYLDRIGFPWLTKALRTGFRRGLAGAD